MGGRRWGLRAGPVLALDARRIGVRSPPSPRALIRVRVPLPTVGHLVDPPNGRAPPPTPRLRDVLFSQIDPRRRRAMSGSPRFASPARTHDSGWQ